MDHKIAEGSHWTSECTKIAGSFQSSSTTRVDRAGLTPLERMLTRSQGFYDPVNEKLFEPDLTGISYSFTSDGYYEQAYYRAVSNRAFLKT